MGGFIALGHQAIAKSRSLLTTEISSDSEILQRFEQEARAT
jgi:hypothetical protein